MSQEQSCLLYILCFIFTLMATQQDHYYCLHFKDGETDVQRHVKITDC